MLGNPRVAEVFTALNTGALTRFEVAYSNSATTATLWTVQINTVDASGKPTNSSLASETFQLGGGGADGPTTASRTFAQPPAVVAGQRYALVVHRHGSSNNLLVASSDVCPDTQMWLDVSTNGNWDPVGFDMRFAVFVEPTPAAPEPGPATKADGTLTIDANKGKVERGRKVTLTGQLDVPTAEACEPGRQIQIQRRLKSEDDSKFATFTTVQTDATGNYSTKQKVKKTYFYRAVVQENASCDDESSNSQKVRVQKKKAAQEA